MSLNDVNVELAKRAYIGYGSATSFRNYQNLPMPTWEELPPRIQTAWLAAVTAILTAPKNETTTSPVLQSTEQQVQPDGFVQCDINGNVSVLPGDTRGRVGDSTGRPDVSEMHEKRVESPRPDGFENLG